MGQQSSIQSLQPFEMVVDTTIAGDSGVGNFKIETDPLEVYRYKVEWGDGTVSGITTTSDVTHTYPSGGTYTIKISGRFDTYLCDNSIEADKIISINSWGNVKWKQLYRAFRGASNLSAITSDAPNFESLNPHTLPSNITFLQVFDGCTNLDGNLGSWDMSNVNNTTSFFQSCNNFNNGGSPSISGWSTSNITSMTQMFYNCFNFNQPIGSWDVSNVIGMTAMFQNADSFNQDIGNWDVSNVLNITQMFNLNGGFNNGGSPSISGWTFNSGLTNMGGLFRGANTFNQPIGSWDVSNVTNMFQMFYLANAFDQDLGNWDVSNVQNMSRLFFSANNFNNGGSPSMSGWTTSACTNAKEMFYNADLFNQDIGNWDMSNVITMNGMFWSANNFNNGGSPSMSGWTTSACTNMSQMFQSAGNFNININSWDVSNVQNFSNMFRSSTVFNQDLGSWDVSSATDMSLMFSSAPVFNQDLGNWDVSNVQNMSSMFGSANPTENFNNGGSPSISGWTTSACTDMSLMFERNLVFNQPIGSWDVSNVQNFSYMLGIGPSIDASNMTFNQDVSGWDVSSATDMTGMFEGCSGFNQDISSWVVSGVTDMSEMLERTGISTENYNKILTGWTGWDGVTATTQLQTGVTFGVDGLTYSTGTTADDARNYLLTGLSWTINGDIGV